MSSLSSWHVGDTARLWEQAKPAVEAADTLCDAMQALMGAFYESYQESLVLARAFLTVPWGELPADRQAYVTNLLDGKAAEARLRNDTPVLSLVGTRGKAGAWNSASKSEGHLGIPLISGEFVTHIPMVSRLLTDLGIGVDLGVDPGATYRDDPADHVRTFYVEDALTDEDAQGRKVIVNQEFVKNYGVRSVFGGGGPYPETPRNVLALIFFAIERVSLDTARAFDPLFSAAQDSTQGLLLEAKVF